MDEATSVRFPVDNEPRAIEQKLSLGTGKVNPLNPAVE
jgi:hypothetical protein